jgi:hypothetical protein
MAADFSVILIQMRDSSAVKLVTRISGDLAPSEGICNFNTRFPRDSEYRTENSSDTLRDVIVLWNKIENAEI